MSRTKTALVVDDEDQLLRLMTRVLERAGHRVHAAATGEAARQLFREHDPEIVLLDVMMPDGDGAERLLPEFLAVRPTLRVILTSGAALPASLEALLGRIGGDFLCKPFPPRSLLQLLEGHAAKVGPAAAPSPPDLAGPGGR
jgi:DNA-binding response OmpR family regulator